MAGRQQFKIINIPVKDGHHWEEDQDRNQVLMDHKAEVQAKSQAQVQALEAQAKVQTEAQEGVADQDPKMEVHQVEDQSARTKAEADLLNLERVKENL